MFYKNVYFHDQGKKTRKTARYETEIKIKN